VPDDSYSDSEIDAAVQSLSDPERLRVAAAGPRGELLCAVAGADPKRRKAEIAAVDERELVRRMRRKLSGAARF